MGDMFGGGGQYPVTRAERRARGFYRGFLKPRCPKSKRS